jgi:hypothetical protein
MKRFWIMLLAVALALVMALPAGAKKPPKPLIPIPACGFEYDLAYPYASDQVLVSDICIWTLPKVDGVAKTGVWEITLEPILPKNTKRPLDAWADVRDGVPGNWCTMEIGTGSRVSDRWKAPYPDDLSVTGPVYLPGEEDFADLGLADGMCLGGGAGGEYIEVGNPDSFYLRTSGGRVEVQWVRDTP